MQRRTHRFARRFRLFRGRHDGCKDELLVEKSSHRRGEEISRYMSCASPCRWSVVRDGYGLRSPADTSSRRSSRRQCPRPKVGWPEPLTKTLRRPSGAVKNIWMGASRVNSASIRDIRGRSTRDLPDDGDGLVP